MIGVLLLSTLAISAPTKLAIVVGNNAPLPGSDYAALVYADDDAVRVAAFLEAQGTKVELLAVPGPEAKTRYPEIAARAKPPTHENLIASLVRAQSSLESAREAGDREVYFYYSGHGSMSTQGAYVHLLDRAFTRAELFQHALRGLQAERKHIIIDSCHSYFLVNQRGRRFPAEIEDSIDRHPEAGFLLSTSDSKEVHEWSGYGGGVFTYQLLSALQGPGDVDGDGNVSYEEAHGFLVAANIDVGDVRARVQPFVRRPLVGATTLARLSDGAGARISLPRGLVGHLRWMDRSGRRVLDLHRGRDQEIFVSALDPIGSVESATVTWVMDTESGLSRLVPVRPDPRTLIAQRGPLEDEFRLRLFLRPLTSDFVLGLSATQPPMRQLSTRVVQAPVWHEDPWTWTFLGGGTASLLLGVVSSALLADAVGRANERPVRSTTEEARVEAETWRAAMVGGFVGAGTLLTSALVRALTLEPKLENLEEGP